MTNNVWFITGAGRGMGLDITKAALTADHKVVATGRDTDKVAQAVGESPNLFVVKLDVTNPANAESAVKSVIDRFGRIDVLVNNAASFYAGYFEEITPEQMAKQLATSPRRAYECHPRRPSNHAQTAFRTYYLYLV